MEVGADGTVTMEVPRPGEYLVRVGDEEFVNTETRYTLGCTVVCGHEVEVTMAPTTIGRRLFLKNPPIFIASWI